MSIDINTIEYIIKELGIINDEMGQLQISVAILQTQMAELMWWFRGISIAILGLLISQVWQVIFLKRNNKKKSK